MIPSVIKMYEETIKMEEAPYLDFGSATTLCGDMPIRHVKSPIKAHLFVIFTYETNTRETYIAWARQCHRSSSNRRVIVGRINLNLA